MRARRTDFMGLTQFFMSPKSDQKRAKCPIFCWYGTFFILWDRSNEQKLFARLYFEHKLWSTFKDKIFFLQKKKKHKNFVSLSTTLRNILFLCIVSVSSSTTFQNASKQHRLYVHTIPKNMIAKIHLCCWVRYLHAKKLAISNGSQRPAFCLHLYMKTRLGKKASAFSSAIYQVASWILGRLMHPF